MPSEPLTVATGDDRVTVRAARTEWDHDGTLTLYDADDVAIAEFPDACWCAHAERVE